MSNIPFDIIFFAALAAFVIYKLYTILGSSNDNDKGSDISKYIKGRIVQVRPDDKKPGDNIINLATGKIERLEEKPLHENPDISKTLASIMAIDKNFTPQKFSEGAKKAFEMIINSFAKEDKSTLGNLLSKEILGEFTEAIDKRLAAEERLETTIIAIVSSDIVHADLQKNMANITMRFVSDQVNITRNKTGEIISGDIDSSERIEDIWTFSRNIESHNPNWTLVATSHQGI